MNARIICLAYGVGLLGFTSNPIVASEGFFAVNAVHNLVPMFIGVIFLTFTLKFPGYESRLIKLMGIGGIAVTILGFMTPGDTMMGIIHVNAADHWLHLGLGVVILASAYIYSDQRSASAVQLSGTH
jgi:uncharacterized protein DUF4383